MSIDRTDHDAVTVVRPDGERLDIAVASDFRNALLELIQNGRRNLVVNLKDVSFIDSSGLGALVSALKTLKANGRLDAEAPERVRLASAGRAERG